MGMPAHAERKWTAATVRQLIAAAPRSTPRYELVGGELLVTPSPGPVHQQAVALLLVALTGYCRVVRTVHVLPSPADVELAPDDVRQPDLFVMTTNEWQRVRREGFPVRELVLAIEVVSPSSARIDRVIKRPLYHQRVEEYWVVDTDARLVERWRRDDPRPEMLASRLEWLPAGSTRPFEWDLAQYFDQVWSDD